MRYICIWAESPPELSLAEVSCHVCGLLMSASAATEAQEAAKTRERKRWRRRRRRWWCCSWWLSSPGFKPFKMCCYDRAAVISSRWREAAAAAALQSSLYSQQSTQSLVFSVFACSASALRQALKLRAASTGLGGSLSLSFSMQIILRVGDIKREMTPLSHLSSSLHKLMLTRKAAWTR